MATLPNKTALLNQIANLLPLALDPAYATRAATNDLYEVVNFCLVVQAAEDAKGNITFKDGDDNAVTSLCFSTQPHNISRGPYTHALIEFENKLPLEAHLGIYVSPQSVVDPMECDVCVVHKSEAEFFRNNANRTVKNRGKRKGPDGLKLLIAVECKYWKNDLNSAKAYECIGRFASLSAKHRHIVAATPSKSAGRKILERLKCYVWQPELLPTNIPAMIRFRGLLSQEFIDYQAESRNNQP
ncbi:hypothetical protein [Ktedonobacter robiniae]|uniref:Restriction endonuclease type IV Mrr domain-containing protein n=1 Tax=Ktedonobacter robiniae TaxID=2778365 RepID=A0ABQ3V2U5_9CHLR|nr:hypothetical protein [Ktedonobacter robiniae]GHO59199.1 hypothetical protein KSB_76740 [Ktedonobacter robiniae]